MFQIGGSGKQAPAEKKPKAPRKPPMVSVTIQLDPRQKKKLDLLGGDAWVRDRIDEARFESVFDG